MVIIEELLINEYLWHNCYSYESPGCYFKQKYDMVLSISGGILNLP